MSTIKQLNSKLFEFQNPSPLKRKITRHTHAPTLPLQKPRHRCIHQLSNSRKKSRPANALPLTELISRLKNLRLSLSSDTYTLFSTSGASYDDNLHVAPMTDGEDKRVVATRPQLLQLQPARVRLSPLEVASSTFDTRYNCNRCRERASSTHTHTHR